MTKTVITFGTFDLFHIGHLRLLARARALGDRLVVGVSTDKLNFDKKRRYPVFDETARLAIVGALRCVDETFFEESLALKGDYIKRYNAQLLVMGDDWAGRFDEYKSLCNVEYLSRTEGISTTDLIDRIIDRLGSH